MLNITKHKENANQNHQEISPHTNACQNDYYKKKKKTINDNTGDDVGERKPSSTVDRNVNWYNHNGKQYGVSSKN